jgi:hypothetical protein
MVVLEEVLLVRDDEKEGLAGGRQSLRVYLVVPKLDKE